MFLNGVPVNNNNTFFSSFIQYDRGIHLSVIFLLNGSPHKHDVSL